MLFLIQMQCVQTLWWDLHIRDFYSYIIHKKKLSVLITYRILFVIIPSPVQMQLPFGDDFKCAPECSRFCANTTPSMQGPCAALDFGVHEDPRTKPKSS